MLGFYALVSCLGFRVWGSGSWGPGFGAYGLGPSASRESSNYSQIVESHMGRN